MSKLSFILENFETFLKIYTIPPISPNYKRFNAHQEEKISLGITYNPVLSALRKEKIQLENNADLYAPISRLCIEKGIDESELYKRGNFDKSVLTRIRTMKYNKYVPQKNILLRICLVLELSHDQTLDLLSIAGYTLSNELPAEKIVSFAISEKIYDISYIDDAIFKMTGKYYLSAI